jgi:large subunit ribosomal protein L25
MAELTLKVTAREKASGKALTRSRKEGRVPAVMYGHGIEPQMFWVDAISFSKLYAKAGESSILSLAPEDGKAANVIIHDVQLDALSNRFSHVDFFQVRMDEKLETHVPLEFVGEAPAVRENGGILVKPLEELHISCLPKDLPHSITVDISTLKTFEDQIQVKDIKIPAGVEVLIEEGSMVAFVEAPRTDAQMAALDEKPEGDVTKVEGVVKEEAPAATDDKAGKPEKKEEKK